MLPRVSTTWNQLRFLDGFVRPLNGFVHGILDGSGRGAGEFDEFIDVVFHAWFFPVSAHPQCRNVHLIAALEEQASLTAFSIASRVFAGALLNPTVQFVVLALDVLEIIIRELGPLLFSACPWRCSSRL